MTSLHQARRALAESSSTAAAAPADEAVAQLKRVLTGALDGKHADLEASSLLLSASVTPPMALSASSGFSSSVSVADIGAAVSLEQRDILSRSIMRLTAPQSTEDKSALDRLCILGYQRSLAAMLLEKRDGNFAAALNDLKSIYKVGKEA
jgi:hypothetical protein